MTVLAGLALTLAALSTQADSAYQPQRVSYRIEARLDEETETLSGRARLRYHNRSATTIDTLWLHLHLNAFRPNSAWARRELETGERRFTDLGPEQHAFERVSAVVVGGHAVSPVFPGAPDSTVMAVPLPAPLLPDSILRVDIDWRARPSTTPRRQGRRGRAYDFAQWYPRIAAFDRGGWQVQPLMPQGEFYGEFGDYDVTLDVAEDQVLGATGVPVDGDPGWEGARAQGAAEPWYRRDVYREGGYAVEGQERLGLLSPRAMPSRKHVRWHARDVHHFAWSTNPEYIYEGGRSNDIAIHVLYQPGDTDWQNVAVQRTADALAFFDEIFGTFAWPQLTNVHRIEGGGTEFPMMIMDGSASEGLIVHEVAHNYVHGILANNEWKEGWLDEGFASFLGSWYQESRGADPSQVWASSLQTAREIERLRAAQPIDLPSAAFRDFATYQWMTYTKPSIVYRMLRWVMGEEAFRRGLRHYYERNRLSHVSEADLRAAMEWAHGEDLGWFFQQWIHTTDTLDYRIGEVSTTRGQGGWTTRVEVIRAGDIWMPVDLRVGAVTQRLTSRERTQVVTITTAARPSEARLDPANVLLDLDPANNAKAVQ
jgi:hypothetical protein